MLGAAVLALAALVALWVIFRPAADSGDPEPKPPAAAVTPSLPSSTTLGKAAPSSGPSVVADPVLVGAGDIAGCTSPGDEATARLLDSIPGTVFTAGDNAYPNGTASEFASCYGPSWGRHKDRTRPAPGNHDYETPEAGGYFAYFGAAAGPADRGYYSYDLGSWHVVALNSNCGAVGGCHAGSPQEQWVRSDLAAAAATQCTVAYWHHPRFTSGAVHPNATFMRPIFQALYDSGAEVVVSGHNHNYERFAPQDAQGARDDSRGIRQFVVGTGGISHYRFDAPKPNSEVRSSGVFGVLKLTLHTSSYDWGFVPAAGGGFRDSGSANCH